jgi:hypothetical protein
MVDLNPIVSYIVGQGAARRGEHPTRVPFCIAFVRKLLFRFEFFIHRLALMRWQAPRNENRIG